jgi:hypothetical protein
MEIDAERRQKLIEFAKSQMARRGEIDTLIFTTQDITAGLLKASDDLDKAVKDVSRAIGSLEEHT